MKTWIQDYINGYEAGSKSLPLSEIYPTCKDLLGDLIPIAVREMTKQKPLQEKVEEEVRGFLSNRQVCNSHRNVRIFEEEKAYLSSASHPLYKSFMITSKFKPRPRTGLRYCIRDFLYAIHRSYDEHRDMIDEME
ncbi:MAG: hypothetical protein DHS80DRAFT_22091 [Piptocephalis tieghemiana]|nr:MAG: hypothetical protein DHS80DRAFT_22091 [Piptocephalis tieghemiana]